MKALPKTFTSKGWEFTLFTRSTKAALYERRQPGDIALHWEVILIRTHQGRIWPDGCVTPPGEFYPGSEGWGIYGWTFTPASHANPFEAAFRKFKSISE